MTGSVGIWQPTPVCGCCPVLFECPALAKVSGLVCRTKAIANYFPIGVFLIGAMLVLTVQQKMSFGAHCPSGRTLSLVPLAFFSWCTRQLAWLYRHTEHNGKGEVCASHC